MMSDKAEEKSSGGAAEIFTPREQKIIVAAMIHSEGMANVSFSFQPHQTQSSSLLSPSPAFTQRNKQGDKQNLTREKQLDFTAMADRLGLTNPRSVSNAWAVIKKKVVNHRGEDGAAPANGSGGSTPSKATSAKATTTPSKRGAGAAGMDELAGDEDFAMTPTPTKKPRARKLAAPKNASPDGGEDSATKPKARRGRPTKAQAAAAAAKAAEEEEANRILSEQAQLNEDHKTLNQIAIDAGENVLIKQEDEDALLQIKKEVADLEMADVEENVPGVI